MDNTAIAEHEHHDWTKARLRPESTSEQREKDIFAGNFEVSESTVAGVPVLRIAVSPNPRTAAPQSYALDPNNQINWQNKPASSSHLAYTVEWQQSRESRWDFYFHLPTGVDCLGLGERFSGNNLRGTKHTLCATDQPHHNEGADALYKSIPFLIMQEPGSSNCTAMFLDSPAPQVWDLDSALNETGHVKLLSRRGWTLYVFAKGSLAQIVEAFTQLTGRAAMPPLWSLGHQQCRWSYPDRDTVLAIAEGFRKRDIACDTVVLDIDYMDEYRVFTHSLTRFPDLKKLTSELREMHLNTITIVDPGIKIDPSYVIYKEAIAKDLICLQPNGKAFVEEVWPGECVFPDFLKPETRQWWGDNLKFYVNNGVAGIWNDMNEPAFFIERKPLPKDPQELPAEKDQRFTHQLPEGRVGHLEVRNLYGHLMSQATAEGLQRLRPGQRPFVLTRSGYAGTQKYAAVWLGDNMSWYEHLKKSIPMLVNMGLSGITFAGVDVGGFGGDCDAELLVRWYETAIFYPFFRNHCRMEDRAQEPWAFGEKVEKLVSGLIEMRYKLLPYLYTLFHEHGRTGAPVIRPLSWHYPEDRLAREADDQFMFGKDILVAPIVDRARTFRHVYLPKGRWFPINGGAPLEGNSLHTIDMPLGTVPAFVRDGAILPLCASAIKSTNQYAQAPIAFTVFGDIASGQFIEDDGISDKYLRGEFNVYELTFAAGNMSITPAHKGFTDTVKREFFVEHNGQRRKL